VLNEMALSFVLILSRHLYRMARLFLQLAVRFNLRYPAVFPPHVLLMG
jgi:hypothetical protein